MDKTKDTEEEIEKELKTDDTSIDKQDVDTVSSENVDKKTTSKAKEDKKSDDSPKKRNTRRELVGIVKSDKMTKTISVDVVRRIAHKAYKKIIKRTTRLYAHDEKEEAKQGDKVLIMQTRPTSKLKNWRLVKILKH